MAKWKLARQIFREEEYMFSEGDKITIGRGLDNTITLSSLMISRHHCVIEVKRDNILIKDLKSSNGTYIEKTKIPENQPYVVKDSDVIGFGWAAGASLIDINNEDKYVFKLVKESCDVSIRNRITFQSEPDDTDFCDDIEAEVGKLNKQKLSQEIPKERIPEKNNLKRKQEDKAHIEKGEIKQENTEFHQNAVKDVINLLSDSDSEANKNQKEHIIKKIKQESLQGEPLTKKIKQECVKVENEDILEYEPFKVKQEYLGYYDDVIELVDSDSDSESEKWKQRLSQNSPGKPFIKMKRDNNVLVKQDDSSYSQLDDDGIDIILDANQEVFEDDDIIDDLITIPVQPPPVDTNHQTVESDTDYGEYLQDANPGVYKEPDKTDLSVRDTVDALSTVGISKVTEIASPAIRSPNDVLKGAQMIDPLVQTPGRKTNCVSQIKNKSTFPKHSKGKRHSTSRRHISNSQKEERKKKLKEIAIKEKDDIEANRESCVNVNKPKVNVKVTSSNRGAFLTAEVAQAIVKPLTTKTSPQKSVNDKKSTENLDETKKMDKHEDCENTKRPVKSSRNEHKRSKHRRKKHGKHERSKSVEGRPLELVEPSLTEQRVPVKNLTPLTDSSPSLSGKPVSKVEPLPPKKLPKKVRFTDAPPKVHVFQIEPGNRMKKTSLVKTTLVDIRQTPIFSLQKLSLMKILRWNPHWLEEQINNNDPPPILSHNNTPMTMIHFFHSHSQYVQLVGDLLLMEIWECLSQAYMKIRGQFETLQMVIQSLPPVPSQDRYFDLFNISVNVSLPKTPKNQKSDPKLIPRVGEILYVTFGPEKSCRFFFVHNVRRCPSDTQLVYSISLQTTYTDKMCVLRVGDTVAGTRLAYVNNELVLFEAMEHVGSSPLGDLILKPEPHHFPPPDPLLVPNIKSQWMLTLNESQQAAVVASVASALGDRPAVQMVQGPPGTGKSSVICAIVMTYFYDLSGKKYQNRGKILICATSNPAVDELVLRLLAIRQKMPKPERFRMVRVGRAEAMHPRAQDVSSQQLAQRDAARAHPLAHAHPQPPGLAEEISHLQAKINMNLAAARDAKDSAQVAYYESRVAYFQNRLTLVNSASGRGGGGEEQLRPEALAAAERRIVEGADIVLTTLASAHNYKMRGLKRRIALCIVDEAGQAIEPETLVPLTLAVTRLTLIGDPRQLPGYICSQRAKKLGLGESLFTRLSSCSEQWVRGAGEGAPVVLLDRQYRMHPAIADYPNRAFYGGRVRDHGPAALDLPVPPYAVVCIASGDRGQGAAGGNETEAWGAARLACALAGGLRARGAGLSLALITPYHAHKDLLRRNLRLLMDPASPPVEVNTVDSFQGQERDVVVVSLARSHGAGFLTDAGRMNVMLTRAKRALLICLNPNALLKNHQWRTLVEDAQKRNVYRVLPNKFCQPSAGGEIVSDDILKYIYK